jgi:hypothetical protein
MFLPSVSNEAVTRVTQRTRPDRTGNPSAYLSRLAQSENGFHKNWRIRMRAIHIFFFFLSAVLIFNFSAQAASLYTLMAFKKATPDQISILRKALGDDFINLGNGCPSDIRAAKFYLNDSKLRGLGAVQMCSCSNHACTIELLAHEAGDWIPVSSFESWASPYVSEKQTNQMPNIVIFDHVTNDCMACSPPQPLQMIWDPDAPAPGENQTNRKGAYKLGEPLPKTDVHFLRQKDFNGK